MVVSVDCCVVLFLVGECIVEVVLVCVGVYVFELCLGGIEVVLLVGVYVGGDLCLLYLVGVFL